MARFTPSYYTYSEETGIEYHLTEDEAKVRFRELLEFIGYDDINGDLPIVVWGKISEVACVIKNDALTCTTTWEVKKVL